MVYPSNFGCGKASCIDESNGHSKFLFHRGVRGLRRNTTIIVLLVFALAVVLPTFPVCAADEYRTRSQIIYDFLALEAAYPTLISYVIIGSSVEL